MKRRIFERLGVWLLALAFCQYARACGPEFPNSFLVGGDHAMLLAPMARFGHMLDRIRVPPPEFRAKPTTDPTTQSAEVDVADLRLALIKSTMTVHDKERLLKDYQTERQKLIEPVKNIDDPEGSGNPTDPTAVSKASEPVEIKVIDGLPGEFADYFRARVARHNGHTDEARKLWLALLGRPKNERHYRSVWAAYMLGQTCGTNETAEAGGYYAQVRALARQGFSDNLGLAAASYGWEAQVYLRRKKFDRAVELYLQQYATGDNTAGNSLRETARDAFREGIEALEPLAKNPTARQVVTAYVIYAGPDRGIGENDHDLIHAWLETMESAAVKDVDFAAQLALAAYQNGQMATAQRWINRAKGSPAAQWLQSKLFLRDGKVKEAAALLAQIAPAFPIETGTTNDASPPTLEQSLAMEYEWGYGDGGRPGSPGRHILGELGVLHLERREYRQSLDCLLRSGYWLDAAYVAERVLTFDELKEYVDQEWPPAARPKPDAAGTTPVGEDEPPFNPRRSIRYLLGRRMARMNRGTAAREYFPPDVQPRLDELLQALDAGWDVSSTTNQRAGTLFRAAKSLRESGLELVGTEVGPDWLIHEGAFEGDLTAGTRTNETTSQIVRPSADELRRYGEHSPDPDLRFHYRYQAAFTAWEAAKLMPNNSDDTAKVLWTAGCWLKNRDPVTADIFYKALVRRCRKTALGEEADRIRWFPQLDESGKIIPGKTRRKQAGEIPPPEPVPVEENPPDEIK